MLNGDGNENGNKIGNRSNKQKNKLFAPAAHFLYISLPLRLFFTNTMPFCTTKTSNFFVTNYFLWRNCRIFSPKILVLEFLFAFIFFSGAHIHLADR